MKLRIVALHLVGEGTLWTTEGFRYFAVRNFRVIKTHLNDKVCIGIKLTKTGYKVFQKVMIRYNGLNGRPIIRNIIREGTVTVWK